jgi:predicted dehydrogenase
MRETLDGQRNNSMSPTPPLRIGLIGLGTVGRLHLEAYRELKRGQIVAVADSDTSVLAKLGTTSEIKLYTDLNDMLAREQLDIACVMTPAASHESLTAVCAEHRVNVLCEKPLALTVESARRMIAKAKDCGTRLFYGSSYRFLPAVVAARKLILSGDIGQVLIIREQSIGGQGADRSVSMPFHHYPKGFPGGFAMGLVDHGIHLIDVFSWMMNTTARRASGKGNISGSAMHTEHLTIEYANGAIGHLLYSECTFATDLPVEGQFSQGDGWDFSGFTRAGGWIKHPGCIHVHGTNGSLRVFHYANLLFHFGPEGVKKIAIDGEPAPAHFAAQMECFIDDVLLDRPASTSAEAGVDALSILYAAYENKRSDVEPTTFA